MSKHEDCAYFVQSRHDDAEGLCWKMGGEGVDTGETDCPLFLGAAEALRGGGPETEELGQPPSPLPVIEEAETSDQAFRNLLVLDGWDEKEPDWLTSTNRWGTSRLSRKHVSALWLHYHPAEKPKAKEKPEDPQGRIVSEAPRVAREERRVRGRRGLAR